MIPQNVINIVYKVKYKTKTGSCFTVYIENKQYFITAKHVLQIEDSKQLITDKLKDGDTIEIFHENLWKKMKTVWVAHHNEADVSVFSLEQKIEVYPLPATMAEMFYGQDVYFLGFPYGFTGATEKMNRGFPFPFVKKGIISAINFEQPGTPFLIDGHNNSGFSGGPVVFQHLGSHNFRIAGIISGYYPELTDKEGSLAPIKDTNSGIIVAYAIKNAIDLINQKK